MSGYRRYSKSRYGYRRRRYYGYRYRRYGMSTARKANIAYRSTRKMVKRQEVKTYESSFGGQFTSSGGSQIFSEFAQMSRGTGENQRIGTLVTPTSLRLKVRLEANDTGDPISGNFTKLCRIIIFVWKAEGSPTLDKILEGGGILSHKNDQYKYNSKILYDKVHKVDS